MIMFDAMENALGKELNNLMTTDQVENLKKIEYQRMHDEIE